MNDSPRPVLFAQIQVPPKKAGPRSLDPSEYIFPFVMLMGVMLVAIGIFVYVRKKFEASKQEDVDPHTILADFREAWNEGDLSDEEFRKIKKRMESSIVGQSPDNPKGGDPAKRNNKPGPKINPRPKPKVETEEELPRGDDLTATEEMPKE